MNPELLRVLQKAKEDFPHYASKCLMIRPKHGTGLEKFILNKAQLYIHEKVEQQKLETGKIRAIILKGRQQGCCFSPDMRVLTANYKWKTLEEVQVGERLVACDEQSPGSTIIGRKQSRKFRTAVVEEKREFYKQTYEILFDNGARLNVTPDHRMLSKQRGGDRQIWRYVSDLKVGDYIRIATRPPNYLSQTYDDGWMGGMIDGEGSARLSGAKRISICQVDGPILNRMKAYFDNIDIPFKEVIDSRQAGSSSKLGNKPVHRLDIHRLPYIMELFARCRPTRFTNDEWHVGHELPGKACQDGISPWTKIISIKPLERQRVIDLQTSTKTYICEGLVSHNSTYVEGRFYWRVTFNCGLRAFILTHQNEATNNLFEMAKRYHEHCPEFLRQRLQASNSKELIFSDIDSGYKIGTAGNKNVGRSSTIQLLHGSEAAFWQNAPELAAGLMQAVPSLPGTEVFIESTAKGIGNYFHEQWQLAESGASEFLPIFVPWFWQDEYVKPITKEFVIDNDEEELVYAYGLTLEQLNWRRSKIIEHSSGGQNGSRIFKQEYPCNPAEAFLSSGEDCFIQPHIVTKARKGIAEPYGPLIIGCDPARGSDRTSIIRRKGRVAYGLESYLTDDTMKITSLLHRIIEEENPFKVCIDIIGIGAGVYDRLKELGHDHLLVPVVSGESAFDNQRYANRRAEMWQIMKDWLMDSPCQIPDNDSLHADLCNIEYKYKSNNQLLMESKDDMRSRGIRSPDEADALAYTFAVPDSALRAANNSNYKEFGSQLMAESSRLDRLRKKAYGR